MINELKRQVSNAIDDAAGKSKHNNLYIFFDIVTSMLKYGASPNNYSEFEFYKLNRQQRKTYVTHRLSNKMIKRLNDDKYRDIFENKLEFAKRFNEFFRRDFISSKCEENEFMKFAEKNKKVICKPIHEAQANGIKVLNLDKYKEELKKIYLELHCSKETIIEEWIVQHDDISRIYPNAVNCLRIITAGTNPVSLLTGGVTFALDGEIANGSKKSIVAPVNMETGIIDRPAATFESELYYNHPTQV